MAFMKRCAWIRVVLVLLVIKKSNTFRCYECDGTADCEVTSSHTNTTSCKKPSKCVVIKKTESNKLVFVRDCLAHAINATCLRSGPNHICISSCETDLCNGGKLTGTPVPTATTASSYDSNVTHRSVSNQSVTISTVSLHGSAAIQSTTSSGNIYFQNYLTYKFVSFLTATSIALVLPELRGFLF